MTLRRGMIINNRIDKKRPGAGRRLQIKEEKRVIIMSGPKSDSIGLGGIAIGAAFLAAGAAVGAVYLTGKAVAGIVQGVAGMVGQMGSDVSEARARQAAHYRTMVEKYRRCLQSVERAERSIRSRKAQALADSSDCGGVDTAAFEGQCAELLGELAKLRETDLSSDADMIGQEADQIENKTADVLRRFDAFEREQKEAAKEYRERAAAREKENEAYRSFRTGQGQTLYTTFVFTRSVLKENMAVTEKTRSELIALMENAAELVGSYGTTVSDVEQLELMREELLGAEKWSEAEASRNAAFFRELLEEIESHLEEYEKAYGDYIAHYIAFMEAVNADVAPGEHEYAVIPKERGAFADVSAIEEEIEELKRATVRRVCSRYTAETISQVMRSHGYTVERDVVLYEDDGSHDTLFMVDGDSRAIHVSVSEAGTGEQTVMMETVRVESGRKTGEGKTTARTVHGRDLDETEREEGYEDQVRFCEMHEQIVSELEELGIIFKKRLSRPEPDRRYSKKIIVYDGISASSDDLKAEKKLINYGERRRAKAKPMAKAKKPGE